MQQQQRQIEELQRQLLHSQEKLKEALLQRQKVELPGPETTNSVKVTLAPLSTNLVSATQSITIPADTKVVIGQGPVKNNTVQKQGPVKIAPATSKGRKVQTLAVSTSAPSLSSVIDSKVSDIKPKIEPKSKESKTKVKTENKPNYLLQPQAIQQSLLQAQSKMLLNNLSRSPQSFLVTSTSTTAVTIPAATIVTTSSTSKESKPRAGSLSINGLNTSL